MMLSRKEQKRSGVILPESWSEKIESLLYRIYQEHCDSSEKEFQVFGLTFPDEFVITASYLNLKRTETAPITYMASIDLKENEQPQKYSDTLVDSLGLFYDSYFATPDWNDYLVNWEEAEYKKLKFYYRITRENIGLTLQADKILSSQE